MSCSAPVTTPPARCLSFGIPSTKSPPKPGPEDGGWGAEGGAGADEVFCTLVLADGIGGGLPARPE